MGQEEEWGQGGGGGAGGLVDVGEFVVRLTPVGESGTACCSVG
jgi:hypothetical protein